MELLQKASKKENKMEYYAKSKARVLSVRERAQKEDIHRLLEVLEKYLTPEEKNFIKKSGKTISDGEAQRQERLEEHNSKLIKSVEDFFEIYGQYFTEKEKRLILDACKYHDYGKAYLLFQICVNPELKKLPEYAKLKNMSQIHHGYLSVLALRFKEYIQENPLADIMDFKVLITAIYFHHTRSEYFDEQDLEEHCETYYRPYLQDFLKKEIKLNYGNLKQILFSNKLSGSKKTISRKVWNQYLLVKGMLNKFDWTVSAGFESAEKYPDLIKKELKQNIESKIGKNLRSVQVYMRENKDKNLIIVAPTGSGKTEAGLLWLDGQKGFYTLPLKVSSNAIYKRIKKNYGYEHVALLHSDSFGIYLKEGAENGEESEYKSYERDKMLSAPVTICTVDQLFEFVYKAPGTEMFAATLKYSKLILDEIQAYSPRVIATLIYGLKTICEMGGSFAIVTATFPPVLGHFMDRYGICEGIDYKFQDFTQNEISLRHYISLQEGELNIERIALDGRSKKVLVICNTVSKAQKVYEQLSGENTYLLHSRYLQRDRRRLEEQIMEFSSDPDASGIWVTTQIVQASLDIDFDLLYTEMCTCDSLLQRMGRCNRRGRYTPVEPNVFIFDNRNGVGRDKIYDLDLYERSLIYLRNYEGKVFTESDKTEYINKVYRTEEIQNLEYYKEIQEYLEYFDEIRPFDYTKKQAKEKFRNIKNIRVVPEAIYEENRTFFEKVDYYLQQPILGKQIRNLIYSKMSDLTLTMPMYNNYWPKGVERKAFSDERIYRARLRYDFNMQTGKGKGLISNEILE